MDARLYRSARPPSAAGGSDPASRRSLIASRACFIASRIASLQSVSPLLQAVRGLLQRVLRRSEPRFLYCKPYRLIAARVTTLQDVRSLLQRVLLRSESTLLGNRQTLPGNKPAFFSVNRNFFIAARRYDLCRA
jgi:hypothetical protein